jgi:broad specificity phosphatase PhoE
LKKDSTTIYLVEHSYTPGDGTKKEILNGWGKRGITPEGKELLQGTADYLKDKNVGETYSSDLPRAIETAEHLRGLLAIDHPNTERRNLRPMDVGLLAGENKDEVQPALDDLKSRPWAKAPGGSESYGKFLGRFGTELHRTIQEALGEDRACVYVTHSHNLGALSHILSGGVAPSHFDSPVGSGGVMELHVEDGGGKVSVRSAYEPDGKVGS